MAQDSSIAPKERVNIRMKVEKDNVSQEVELPFKVAVLGDFTQRPDDTPLEERKLVSVDQDNFNEVLRKMDVSVDVQVPNRLTPDGGELSMSVPVRSMRDLTPDGLVENVSELNDLVRIRRALEGIKRRADKRQIAADLEAIIRDPRLREQLLEELNRD